VVDPDDFDELLEEWFPVSGEPASVAPLLVVLLPHAEGRRGSAQTTAAVRILTRRWR